MKKKTRSVITIQDFQKAEATFSNGWGYWGHEYRSLWTDECIVVAANSLKIPLWILCSYVTSRPARHAMDVFQGNTLKTMAISFFKNELRRWKKELKSDPQLEKDEHNRFVPQSIQYILED